jgi:hypothetical protein
MKTSKLSERGTKQVWFDLPSDCIPLKDWIIPFQDALEVDPEARINVDSGYNNNTIVLCYRRPEKDYEWAKRIEEEKEYRETEKAARKIRKALVEVEEREEYERLKQKFEKTSKKTGTE